MRLFRALSAALVLCLSLALVWSGPSPARATDVDSAEDRADSARRRAAQAQSLFSDAAARRAGIEDEFAASLTRLAELNAELSRVSVRLDELRLAVQAADAELETINQNLNLQAVDAYVRVVGLSAANVVATDTAESALVAVTSLESVIESDQAAMAALTVKRRDLEDLRERFHQEQEEVAAIQARVDEETVHLEALLAEADAELARRAAEAREADAAYRSALDAVALAKAREEEKRRQAQRDEGPDTMAAGTDADPTTTPPPSPSTSSTSTTAPPATTTTTTPVPDPVSGGSFPPGVERWRSLVSAYFPADRVDAALAVIRCESGGDPEAYNPYSGASGLFQFLPSTWATVSQSAGFGGASPFDAEANIGTAAWLSSYYENRGSNPWAPWTCRP
ncbi:MAG TPA: transglycosylase SLT domain-containing protein [Acidimicrobiia bacterium]|nr:transglycosylase SLT domain-containing protein [Acidimicrobiia bacterium]